MPCSWLSGPWSTIQPCPAGPRRKRVSDAHVVVEHHVGALAAERVHRLDLDAGGVEGHEEHREPLVLRRIRVRPRQQEAVVAVLCAGREHLLAIDDPLVAVSHRAGAHSGEIGAPVGLRVAEAEEDLPAGGTEQEVTPQIAFQPALDRRDHEHAMCPG